MPPRDAAILHLCRVLIFAAYACRFRYADAALDADATLMLAAAPPLLLMIDAYAADMPPCRQLRFLSAFFCCRCFRDAAMLFAAAAMPLFFSCAML